MENNFDKTNEIQAPSYILPSDRKSKLIVPLIIFIVLAIAGITFGIFEFINNASLKSEIEDLEAKISALKKPEKPETPEEKPYSGIFEYEHRESDATMEIISKITLNYDTGELLVVNSLCGGTAYECTAEELTATLTDKELMKVWLIAIVDDHDETNLTTALRYIAISEALNTIQPSNMPTDCVNDAETDCATLDYRTNGNKILDDMLFGIYGYINCIPTSCDSEEECNDGIGELTCAIAEEIDYPYIVY